MRTLWSLERKRWILSGTLILSLMVSAAAVAPRPVFADPVEDTAELTPIGHPIWQLAGFQVFSAPIGTLTDSFAEFFQTEQSILPPPNHLFSQPVGIVPGAAHPPPYEGEMVDGVKAAGFDDRIVFEGSQFTLPDGVWLVWMVVPGGGAPAGSSPDDANGPIIPNSIFPITVSAVSTRNGAVFDPSLASYTVPSTNGLPSPILVDGYSHFPNFIADAVEFGQAGSKPEGSYVYSITMTDAAGNGWIVSMRFRVKKTQTRNKDSELNFSSEASSLSCSPLGSSCTSSKECCSRLCGWKHTCCDKPYYSQYCTSSAECCSKVCLNHRCL